MKLRHRYLALCVVGTVLPYWKFLPWLRENGLDLPLFARELFVNRISFSFAMDVLVSAVVVCIFAGVEGKRANRGSREGLPEGAHIYKTLPHAATGTPSISPSSNRTSILPSAGRTSRSTVACSSPLVTRSPLIALRCTLPIAFVGNSSAMTMMLGTLRGAR